MSKQERRTYLVFRSLAAVASGRPDMMYEDVTISTAFKMCCHDYGSACGIEYAKFHPRKRTPIVISQEQLAQMRSDA